MRRSPAERIGLIRVAKSIVPPVVAPAPTVACISSIKRIGSGWLASAEITALNRSSKSPRNRVPASKAAVSRENTSAPTSRAGIFSSSNRAESPSASAVFPTPASPTNIGLFLRRRHKISSVLCNSRVRPIRGSSFPARARSERLTAYSASGS